MHWPSPPSLPARPRFLVIPFQALWYIIVDDVSHIGFINPHSKCDSSYNYVDLFHQEIILILRSRCRIHTCMVSTGVNPVGLKYLSKLFYLLPAQAIMMPDFSGLFLMNFMMSLSTF